MLMFFEGMLCKQRQSSLMMLRNMRRPPTVLYVLRSGKWDLQSSEFIFPGDVISLTIHANYTKRGRRIVLNKIRLRVTSTSFSSLI